ncbi:hypothetical protein BU16DRAFT_528321 [Lophium mytilinum]|uniref:Uncharacterized protein n=1 Tax=Lophium mytilinum TaxID=390894 RepID=A0A6A6QNU6_9PEZI|nr:hypothetical protein BU16DRAFT_528321 [Lophium mytilinum]
MLRCPYLLWYSTGARAHLKFSLLGMRPWQSSYLFVMVPLHRINAHLLSWLSPQFDSALRVALLFSASTLAMVSTTKSRHSIRPFHAAPTQ